MKLREHIGDIPQGYITRYGLLYRAVVYTRMPELCPYVSFWGFSLRKVGKKAFDFYKREWIGFAKEFDRMVRETRKLHS